MDAADERRHRYLIVRPENGGIGDLLRFAVWADKQSGAKFIQTSLYDDDDVVVYWSASASSREVPVPASKPEPDYRWVIIVSIVVRKILAVFGKPMKWTGYLVEFFLNLLSLNGNLFGLFFNFFQGKLVVPQRDSENFISAIGHFDRRIDLYKSISLVEETDESSSAERSTSLEPGNRGLMDLCIMASKLAYENANVVRDVVNHHWNMHFVGFYNGWNDFQKERSTQVFILCDKPKDANLILVSFRGTEPFDADDWSTDFDYSWYEIPKLGKVHMGFLEALGLGNRTDASSFQDCTKCASFSSIRTTNGLSYGSQSTLSHTNSASKHSSEEKKLMPETAEITAYYALRSKLKSLLREHGNAKFVVTGHSLGGALAILFPTVLVLHEEEEIMQRLLAVYTYGQPRIGNRQLRRFMQAHIEHPIHKYFRVVYSNDLVPRLPYDDKTFLYKHFGMCLYYNSLFVEQKVDEEPNKNFFGMRYLIPHHLNAAWELVRSFTIRYAYGPGYKETWPSTLLRVVGLALPGLSSHSPVDYVNSVRLGRERTTKRPSL